MRLLREILTNFKGIRSFTFEPNGENSNVLAINAVGKTTLYDAFLWLFFDKDSTGKKDFELKTLDAEGKVIPMIDHAVGVVIEHNGAKITLKKTLSESWVKARGTITPEFSGHKTVYEINEVPKQKKEFDAFIFGLGSENVLRMVSDPDYFPGKMAWQDRRKILMDICGDISDADVIDSAVTIGNKSMLDLLMVLNSGRTIDEHRKVLAARKTAVNNEIKAIPIRVDEATRSLPGDGKSGLAELQSNIEKFQAQRKEIETSLLALEQGGAITQNKLRLQRIEAGLLAEQNKAQGDKQAVVGAKRKEYGALVFKRDDASFRKTATTNKITQLQEDINRLKNQWEAKIAEWKAEDAKEAPATETSGICPACGQSLPEEQVQAAIDKALTAFNTSRATNLERIQTEGTAIRTKLDTAEAERLKLEQSIPAIDVEIDILAKKISGLSSEITALDNQPPTEQSFETKALLHEQGNLLLDIKALEESSEPERIRLTNQLSSVQQNIADLQADVARTEARADGLKRIEELKAKEEVLAAEAAQLERQTTVVEEFTRTKVKLLESKINTKFKYARFKMFDWFIHNDEPSSTCEVLGPDGVPYGSGLNNAARINVGIDIINTIGAHYGFVAPIFVDNAEAVTQLIDTPAQLIRLVVPDIIVRDEDGVIDEEATEKRRKKYSKLVVEAG